MFTCVSLLESLRQLRLLDAAQLEEAKQLSTSIADPRQLANELTRRGWLTAFQLRMLAGGRGPQLVLGHYVILEKLGEGGMGAVFKVRNTRLDRVVAVKLLRKERNANVDLIRRFQREVEVASSMSHPNVVRAFDAEEIDGNLVFEMEYVEGINLTQLVHKRGGLPVPMACDFMRQAALGLQHAHEKGLVHRDIKPSNLVVTRALSQANGAEVSPHGLIKLLDMGLALVHTRDGDREKTRLTQLGKVVGTTDFLSPEQARNSHGVDIRADLYSLGCTFYFLLTGRVPFPEGQAMEKLLKHQLDDAEPVEKLRPEVPPDVAAVVRKLMAKKPENRYQTPAEVAALLEPFCCDSVKTAPMPVVRPTAAMPVLPSPITPPPVAVRVMPTPPKPAASAGAVAVLEPRTKSAAAATSTAAAVATVPDRAALPAAVQSKPKPRVAKAPAAPEEEPGGKRSWLVALVMLGALASLGVGGYLVLRRDAPTTENPGDPSTEKVLPKEPWSLDQLAADDISPTERIRDLPPQVVRVIGEHRQRHWGLVTCVAYSKDGKIVASAGHDGFMRLWNTETGLEAGYLKGQPGRVFALAFLDDSLLSVSQVGGAVRGVLWLLGDMAPIKDFPLNKGGRPVTAAAISPDGTQIALAGLKPDGAGEVWVVAVKTEQEQTLATDKSFVTHLAWSPDSKLLAGAAGKTIKLWGVSPRLKELAALPGHEQPISGLAFVNNGKMLASCCSLSRNLTFNGEIKLWNVPAGTPAATVPVPGHVIGLSHDAKNQTLAWGSVNGGSDYRVTLWSLADNKERASLGSFDSRPITTAIAPDGQSLASVGEDQVVRLWDIASGKERPAPPRARGPIGSLVLSPDGQTMAYLAGTGERNVVLSDLATGKERVLGQLNGIGLTLGFIGEGKILAGWGRLRAVFWEVASGQELSAFKPPNDSHLVGAVAPDGHSVLVAGKEIGVKLWDPFTGKERVAVRDQARVLTGFSAFSPDGTLVALAASAVPGVLLCNTTTGKDKWLLRGLTGPVTALTYSPDGQSVAAVAADGSVRVWSAATGKESCKAATHGGMTGIAFSGDGSSLAVWGWRAVCVVNVATGKTGVVRDGLETLVTGVAFVPQSPTLVYTTDEGSLFLVNPATPEGNKQTKIALPGPVHALAAAADGRHLVTANGNGTLYVLRLDAK